MNNTSGALPPIPNAFNASNFAEYAKSIQNSRIEGREYIRLLQDKVSQGIDSRDFIFLVVGSTVYEADIRFEVTEVCKNVIKNFILNRNFNDALIVENWLWDHYLRRLESEEAYNDLFKKIDSAYKELPIDTLEVSSDAYGYLFVTHTANMLAHTNSLYTMLKANGNAQNQFEKIGLVVLGEVPQEYADFWSEIGIAVYSCQNIDSFDQRIMHIESIRAHENYSSVIWLCTPLWLCFASRVVANLAWWSVKFHPGISGLNRYIGSLGPHENFTLYENNWVHFVSPVTINNLNSVTHVDWALRRKKFGCFTRSELIDNQAYWQKVCLVLKKHRDISFNYAGKSEVHANWVNQDSEFFSRITFLGWLERPESAIAEYSFLLDPFPLGHGNLARESFAASVPIIYPIKKGEQSYCTVNKLLDANPMIKAEIYTTTKNLKTSYASDTELLEICSRLLTNSSVNKQIGNLYRRLLDNQIENNSWANFKIALHYGAL